jgi:hypothetical protein
VGWFGLAGVLGKSKEEVGDSRRGRLGYLIETPKIQDPDSKDPRVERFTGDTTRSTIPDHGHDHKSQQQEQEQTISFLILVPHNN